MIKDINGVNNIIINSFQGFSLNFFVDDLEPLDKVRSQLSEDGFDIFALSESRPSLDDVYLQATGKTLMDAELEVTSKRDFKKEAKQAMR